MKYLFFSLDHDNKSVSPPEKEPAFASALWRPTLTRIAPRGVFKISFVAWWIFHYLGIFKNRSYGIFLFYDGRKVIHYACLFPGYFRFPFMGPGDLQIGDVFTDEAYRGRSLATESLRMIVRGHSDAIERFWYITEEGNAASIRVAEKAGFIKAGEGRRTRRLGIRILGAYRMDEPAFSDTSPWGPT